MNNLLSADQLNQNCACTTLDRLSLEQALKQQLGDNTGGIRSSPVWRQMFADSAVFVPQSDLALMQATVKALEKAASLPGYQKEVLAWAPKSSAINPGPRGALMGYDFHLTSAGPKLIEINTNAGGAFLNAVLARAQQLCCSGMLASDFVEDFDGAIIDMFESEWRAQGRPGRPRRIAIVDDQPTEQYLYPEFRLAQTLLRNHGIDAIIVGPDELNYVAATGSGAERGILLGRNQPVDMVYNRLVDFGLDQPEHASLRQAWLDRSVVITPNPYTHAILADKRNLTVLSDITHRQDWELSEQEAELLRQVIPNTANVISEDAESLWQNRRQLFFKPASSHGSKGVYRGSKITKRVFEEILRGGYVAQGYVEPSERLILVDGERAFFKVDIRLYTYGGNTLLPAARLYRGQATNFRTPGGGFAPVFMR